MDKRVEENNRVKRAIAKAYLQLLRENRTEDIDTISISQITSKANVSRMAYYRNFTTKTQLVEYYLEDILWNDFAAVFPNTINMWSKDYGVAFFRMIQKYKDQILLLDRCGYSWLLLDAFNHTNEDIGGNMSSRSIERYRLYFAAGASYNVIMIWLKSGCRETPEEIAAAVGGWLGTT